MVAVHHHRPMVFIATFQDGYTRTIALGTKTAALKYALNLEDWFQKGSHPGRVLVNVAPKK